MALSATTDRQVSTNSADVTPPFGQEQGCMSGRDVQDGKIAWRDKTLLVEGETSSRHTLEGISQQVSHATIVVTEKIDREAFGLRRALKTGLLALLVALVVMSGLYYRFSRHTAREIQRNYAALAALNCSIANQQELIERARKLSEQTKEKASSNWPSEQKQQPRQPSKQLLAGLARAPADSFGNLGREPAQTEARFQKLDAEASSAEQIIKDYAPSVCLIHVVIAFREATTGRPLRYVTNPGSDPNQDRVGNPVLSPEGTGAEFHIDVLGTGFLAGKDGRILTNRHVVEPWWPKNELDDSKNQGLRPAVVEMRAYFPGSRRAYPLRVVQISPEADLALLHGQMDALNRKVVALDGSAHAAVRGEPIVLMGYATGLDAVFACLDDSTRHKIVTKTSEDPRQILDRLAENNLIRPLITQGHLGDVLPKQIVYDAQTAAGGSGGPVFNLDGKVIGVNNAVVEGFGGANFGVPARFAEQLVAR